MSRNNQDDPENKTQPDVVLYASMFCPYCIKVRHYMKKKNIKLPLKDVMFHSEYRNELIQIGGKGQVPCLVIDGKALYESDDIILWLRKNWSKNG